MGPYTPRPRGDVDGLEARALPLVDGTSIRDDATGATATDLGPPRRDRRETTTNVLGGVSAMKDGHAVRPQVDQDGPLGEAKPGGGAA